ncbi:helix-turn-helix transcriptional regulator [Streptomyces griseorubens]|uniref:helix-turn-helix transcriptional regulator n=1 Tax=Streptomyces griseorubens TaxID=66897 RepID=UPI003515582C
MGLAERRRALGYSQEELAHALGVDRRTVGRWEGRTTTPQPPLRPRLAELLHLDLDELDALGGTATSSPTGVGRAAASRPPWLRGPRRHDPTPVPARHHRHQCPGGPAPR